MDHSFIPSRFHCLSHKAKLIGLVAGAASFGFWGAVVGLITGSAIDQWGVFLQNHAQKKKPFALLPDEPTAILAIVALARQRQMTGLIVPSFALLTLRRFFKIDELTWRYIGKMLAAQHFEMVSEAAQIAQLKQFCQKHPHYAEKVLECLIALAMDTNHFLSTHHRLFLKSLAQSLGIEPVVREGMLGQADEQGDDFTDPYHVLGLTPGAPIHIVNEAYKRLIQRVHPDRWHAHANREAADIAQAQAVRLNAAYQAIKKSSARR